MNYDIQKASVTKRISAFLFDGILTGIIIVAVAWLLAVILGYDGYNEKLQQAYEVYETQYGIHFEITQEEYDALTQEKRDAYDAACLALTEDADATYNYNMVINLTLLIATLSIFFGITAVEFVVPMIFGNGQTLGKKIFGIALMRRDGVKVNGMLMFTRAILGKFTIETMLPVYVIILMYLGPLNREGWIIVGSTALVQLALLAVTRNKTLIHDLLAATVAVDMASQMIFSTTDDLIEYQKKVAAEKATRQPY